MGRWAIILISEVQCPEHGTCYRPTEILPEFIDRFEQETGKTVVFKEAKSA